MEKKAFLDFFCPMPLISVSLPNLGIVLCTNQKSETKTWCITRDAILDCDRKGASLDIESKNLHLIFMKSIYYSLSEFFIKHKSIS